MKQLLFFIFVILTFTGCYTTHYEQVGTKIYQVKTFFFGGREEREYIGEEGYVETWSKPIIIKPKKPTKTLSGEIKFKPKPSAQLKQTMNIMDKSINNKSTSKDIGGSGAGSSF